MSQGRKLWLVGLSHHTAPLEIREQLALENGAVSDVVRRLLEVSGVEEGAVVSTCNRVEALVCSRTESDPRPIRAFLVGARGAPGAQDEYFYVREDQDAVRHLFRVASSLDSLVVGEPQILGQLKHFYQVAAETGGAGPILHRAFHRAFSVAKRIRTETGIAGRNVSVASVAVELATQIFETLGDKTAMILGAGEMSELTARHLRSRGIGGLIFANRTFERAVELAREHEGTPVRFEERARYLRLADVVIGSTAATDPLLTVDTVADVLRDRKQRPMFLIDLGVPRDFDPRINELDNVYLYDVDDLERVLADNREERSREAERAESIVEYEVESFWRWFRGLDVVPTIVKLRDRADEIRRQELRRTLATLGGLGEEERRAIEAMSEALVKKLLHPPIARLKRQNTADAEDVIALRRLFGLDEDE